MKLSDEYVVFDETGGSKEVRCLNYQPRIPGIWDKFSGKYYPFDDTENICSIPGIVATTEKNRITIKVDPSEYDHLWGINLQAGDAFGGIVVYQNTRPE